MTFTYCSVPVRPQLKNYVLFWSLLIIKDVDYVYRIQKKDQAISRNLISMTYEKRFKKKYLKRSFTKVSLYSKKLGKLDKVLGYLQSYILRFMK